MVALGFLQRACSLRSGRKRRGARWLEAHGSSRQSGLFNGDTLHLLKVQPLLDLAKLSRVRSDLQPLAVTRKTSANSSPSSSARFRFVDVSEIGFRYESRRRYPIVPCACDSCSKNAFRIPFIFFTCTLL